MMNADALSGLNRTRPWRGPVAGSRGQQGLTLVELMISLTLGLVLIAGALFLQMRLSQQSMRNADSGFRDNEARSALDAISRDLSSSGFMLASMHVRCANILRYNQNAPTPYSLWLPVTAEAAASGSDVSFVARTSGAGTGLNMSYPPTGGRSDVLAISVLAGTTQMSDAVTPAIAAVTASGVLPMTSGEVAIASSAPMAVGDMGLLQVPVNGSKTCFRVPFTTLTTSAGVDRFTAGGTLTPSTFFTGYSGQLATFGIGGSLSNALLLNAGRVTDYGSAAQLQHLTYVYFVDGNSQTWPVLRRVTVNALTDQVVAGSAVDIAAGVVSFQVTFGTGAAAGNAVTNYRTWSEVQTNNEYNQIRTVRVAMVVRSLFPDPDSAFVSPTTITPTGAGFAAYTVPTAFNRYRHALLQTEVALRNRLWP